MQPIEEPLPSWAVHQEKLLAAFYSLMRRHRRRSGQLPEQRGDLTAGEVAAGEVLISSSRLASP